MTRLLHAALLAIAVLTSLGCEEDRIVKTLPPGFRKDVFPQDATSRIDVLWVIDNSGSMAEEQKLLSDNLGRFMELFNRGQVDYRIAVTTTDVFNDQGKFVGNPAIITPTISDPVGSFQRNVRVGTSGKGLEQGLEAARRAIEREQARSAEVVKKRDQCRATCSAAGAGQKCLDDCNVRNSPEFMRPDAALYVIFVTDEEDGSFGEVRYFHRFFEGALGIGNEGNVTIAAIVGDVPQPTCPSARPGKRYAELADLTGGLVASICDERFDVHLERLALSAVGLKRKFTLSKEPDTQTLDLVVKYRCDTPEKQRGRCDRIDNECAGKGPDHLGLLCIPTQGLPNGWTYENTTHSIFFNGDGVPGLRSVIEVSYQSVTDTGAR
ncbi:MAG: vWA domain-containing protein [Myxococcales bacterium]